MPIWSLTKERLEKLLKQVGDIEVEIDDLIKLSKEDLWDRDLDEFINEWRTQLELEAKFRKQIANMGRRASSKLKISAGGQVRKRKGQGEDAYDSDFGPQPATRKPAATKRAQPRQGLLSHMSPLAKPISKPKPTAPKMNALAPKAASKPTDDVGSAEKVTNDVRMNHADASGSEAAVAPIFKKTKAAAAARHPVPLKKVKSEDEDEAHEEIVRPAASRKPRTATQKVSTYNLDDSDSNGDDFLFDVGKMVKGIENTQNNHTSTSRPLFSNSMSRPGSSAGLPKKPVSSKPTIDQDDDDTDYSKLAPPAVTKTGVSVTARRTLLSDNDMDVDDVLPASKPPPKASKPSKTTVSKPSKPKAPTVTAKKSSQDPSLQKKMPLSPAAKAYAAKKAKNALRVLDDDSDDNDEVDKLANEILDAGEDNVKGAPPGGGNDNDDDEELVVRRPARRAAAKAVERVKKGWGGDSDDDEEEETESETFNEVDDDESD